MSEADRLTAVEGRMDALEELFLELLDSVPAPDPLQQAHGAFVTRIRARENQPREDGR